MKEYLNKKVERLKNGTTVIFSDEELDCLIEEDVSNYFQVLQNPNQIGTKDKWEVKLSPEYYKRNKKG